jgi:hypothetical protein
VRFWLVLLCYAGAFAALMAMVFLLRWWHEEVLRREARAPPRGFEVRPRDDDDSVR